MEVLSLASVVTKEAELAAFAQEHGITSEPGVATTQTPEPPGSDTAGLNLSRRRSKEQRMVSRPDSPFCQRPEESAAARARAKQHRVAIPLAKGRLPSKRGPNHMPSQRNLELIGMKVPATEEAVDEVLSFREALLPPKLRELQTEAGPESEATEALPLLQSVRTRCVGRTRCKPPGRRCGAMAGHRGWTGSRSSRWRQPRKGRRPFCTRSKEA